jgi:hypothetical protein
VRNPVSSNSALNGLQNIRRSSTFLATKQHLRDGQPELGGELNTRADKIGDAVCSETAVPR